MKNLVFVIALFISVLLGGTARAQATFDVEASFEQESAPQPRAEAPAEVNPAPAQEEQDKPPAPMTPPPATVVAPPVQPAIGVATAPVGNWLNLSDRLIGYQEWARSYRRRVLGRLGLAASLVLTVPAVVLLAMGVADDNDTLAYSGGFMLLPAVPGIVVSSIMIAVGRKGMHKFKPWVQFERFDRPVPAI